MSVHDLHIWSLSESKLVASMHILVRDQKESQACSKQIRALLHRFGVHSSTIQPEVIENGKAASVLSPAGGPAAEGDQQQDDEACTVQCVGESCVESPC